MTDDFAAATPRPMNPSARDRVVKICWPIVGGNGQEAVFALDAIRLAEAAYRDGYVAAVNAYHAEPSDEDVERAAIGAATAHYGSFVWERAPQEVQERWRNIARAAIAALRAKP